MRELTINESVRISGSIIGAETAFTVGILMATGAILGRLCVAQNVKTAHTVYEPKITEVRTPVYDANGRYEGDMVDTYTTYEPVIVYS